MIYARMLYVLAGANSRADECAEIITRISATAENGSIWIVDGGKFTQITIPKLWKL